MTQIYKNQKNQETFAQKYNRLNEPYNQDSPIVDSLINKIQDMYYKKIINDEFFQSIINLHEIIKDDPSQFMLLLSNSMIIHFLFEIYQNTEFAQNKLIVLNCLNSFSELGSSICETYLQENFIQLFKLNFSNESLESNIYFIQIYYNILQSITQSNLINWILSQLSLSDFFSLVKKNDQVNEILCCIFMCLNELMKFPIDNIKDEDVIYPIIHYYFFDRKLQNNGSLIVQKVFPQNCLAIISNRIRFTSFNYELFEEFKLFQFIDFYLTNPPIENFSMCCHIISLLIIKYKCDYAFDFKTMIDAFISFNSEKNQFFSCNAMQCMVHMNNSLSNYFYQNDCSLFFFFLDSFFRVSLKTKSILFQLIHTLLQLANSQNWSLIFKNTTKTDEVISENINDDDDSVPKMHMSLFNVISHTLEIIELKEEAMQMLIEIFQKATEMNFLNECKNLFTNVFNGLFDEKFDFNEECVRVFFQTYFDQNKIDE